MSSVLSPHVQNIQEDSLQLDLRSHLELHMSTNIFRHELYILIHFKAVRICRISATYHCIISSSKHTLVPSNFIAKKKKKWKCLAFQMSFPCQITLT